MFTVNRVSWVQAPATAIESVILDHVLHHCPCWGVGAAVQTVDLKYVYIEMRKKLILWFLKQNKLNTDVRNKYSIAALVQHQFISKKF